MIASPDAPHPLAMPARPAEDTPPGGWPGTRAQWRIARRAAAGLSMMQIARDLRISATTVETQMRRMANQLAGAGTRRERICALVRALTEAA